MVSQEEISTCLLKLKVGMHIEKEAAQHDSFGLVPLLFAKGNLYERKQITWSWILRTELHESFHSHQQGTGDSEDL
jgi:hypothetical protein